MPFSAVPRLSLRSGDQADVVSVAFGLHAGERDETEGSGVHAIADSVEFGRSVREDMPQVDA